MTGLTEMILAHEERKQTGGKKKGKKAPGPEDLLELTDGVKNLAKKKRQQSILKEICAKFEAADIDF